MKSLTVWKMGESRLEIVGRRPWGRATASGGPRPDIRHSTAVEARRAAPDNRQRNRRLAARPFGKSRLAFSREIGIHPGEMAGFCARFSSGIFEAVNKAAKEHGSVEALAWVADDLCEEMHDRWRVVDRLAKG